jgi:hypothetical protein
MERGKEVTLFRAQQPNAGQGHLMLEVYRHTSQSVGLLWTKERPVAVTST